jgi:hypothetical protein
MKHRQGTLRKPDKDFMALATTINEQCNQNASEWYIDPDKLKAFNGLLTNAQNAYNANNDKATKNAITSANKKAAFGELKHFLGSFIDYLEVNTYVPDQALAYMGLRSREHHAHQPLPRPQDEIVISVRKQHDEMTIYAAIPEKDHPTDGVGPAKYHGFMIRYREEGKDYIMIASTRLHHTIFFERDDEGKRIFISAAWINPRLETGPWSDEISEIIG